MHDNNFHFDFLTFTRNQVKSCNTRIRNSYDYKNGDKDIAFVQSCLPKKKDLLHFNLYLTYSLNI